MHTQTQGTPSLPHSAHTSLVAGAWSSVMKRVVLNFISFHKRRELREQLLMCFDNPAPYFIPISSILVYLVVHV